MSRYGLQGLAAILVSVMVLVRRLLFLWMQRMCWALVPCCLQELGWPWVAVPAELQAVPA